MHIDDILRKSQDGGALSRKEMVSLLALDPASPQAYAVMATAARISRELSDRKAEVHAQFAINLAPCPCNCLFCSFAMANGIFSESAELTPGHATACARRFETDGANAVFMMSTARYPFERFLEIAREVRTNLRPETTLIANVGDQSLKNAVRLKDAGFTGVYHAVRLREGKDTGLPVGKRKKSISNFMKAGLEVGTCVEPVGPKHTNTLHQQCPPAGKEGMMVRTAGNGDVPAHCF